MGGLGAWVPYSSVYFQALGIDLALIGVLGALPSAVAILGAPSWGLVADRLGDVRPPMLAAGLWAAGMALLIATGPTLPWLALLVIALAAGSSGLTPLLDARTVQRLGSDRERFGQARMWGSVSFVVVSLAVGALVAATAPVAMLHVYASTLALTGIVALLVLGRDRRPPRASGIGPLAAVRLLRDPGMGLFFVGSVVVWIAATGVMTFYSLRLVELGGDARLIGLGWAVGASVEVPVMFAFRRMARRAGVERLIVLGALAFAMRAVLWSVTGSAPALVAVAAFGGAGFALFLVGTTSYVAARAPGNLQVTAQALFGGTAFAAGTILGAVLAGLVAGAGGLAAVFPAGAAVSILGVLLVAAALRPGRPMARGAAASADG